jgi:DNA-binding NarL/FixJ family response regulator
VPTLELAVPTANHAARETGRIRVLTVDDHPLLREGVAAVIARQKDMELVGEAANGKEAVAAYRELRPDVTLMDLRMREASGVEAITAIIAEFPTARVIAMSTYDGDTDIHRALRAGACGYLFKDVLRTDMADAIRTAFRGERVMPTAVAHRLAEYTPRVDLTQRELEVLQLMAKGLRNRDIAVAIGRTEGTVKIHVMNLMRKLEVLDRTEAVTVSLQRGIIHLAEQ